MQSGSRLRICRSSAVSSRKMARPTFVRFPQALPSGAARGSHSVARCSLSSVSELAEGVRSGRVSAEEVTNVALKRIEAVDDRVHAFLTVNAELAVERARKIDNARKNGRELGPLAGVPIAVKDNLCTTDVVTTAASRILDGFVPPYSATAVERLEKAGAVILGKTNLDEFGMGSSTETSGYVATANPWNVDYVPGGSSGGSAAAVSAGMCSAALGTDTGGSIRLPASFCGVTGLKPSYGRVSRHGLLAYASSLDTIGPLCQSALDAASLLQVIAGHDKMDGTSAEETVPAYAEDLLQQETSLNNLTIGIIEEAMGDGVHPEVAAATRTAIRCLESLGAKIRTVSLPRLAASTAAYYILAPSEASANLARYDGVRYGVRDKSAENSTDMYMRSRAKGLGDEVKRRIMLGTYALSSGYYDDYYLRAQRVRTLIANDFKDVFDSGCDVLVSPVAPTPPYRLGEKVDDPVSMYLDDLMTVPASLAGLPALSIPCGLTSQNLPIGLQIVGPYLQESRILSVGHAFQQVTKHHHQQPQLVEDLAVAV